MKWKLTGRSAGRNIVVYENGREERLTDEEFAKLQGGQAVKDLNDRKRAEAAEKALAAANETIADRDAGMAKAVAEAQAATLAAKGWQERCEKAEADLAKANATIEELTAANKALEAKSAGAASDERSAMSDDQEPKVPTSAISVEDAMLVDVSRFSSAKLKAVCDALGIEPGETNRLTVEAIEAERARRAGGGE